MKALFSPSSFAGGILLGAALASAWFLGLTPDLIQAQPPAPVIASSTPPLMGEDASGAVSVANQPSGNQVAVESVTVPPPGVWVAVRDVDSSGALGNVLGAALAGGPRANFLVPLLRATEPGHTYAVELYRDDGNGQFDVSADSVYVDFATGSRVVDYFQTTN